MPYSDVYYKILTEYINICILKIYKACFVSTIWTIEQNLEKNEGLLIVCIDKVPKYPIDHINTTTSVQDIFFEF
jgi:hypothetical protein